MRSRSGQLAGKEGQHRTVLAGCKSVDGLISGVGRAVVEAGEKGSPDRGTVGVGPCEAGGCPMADVFIRIG